MIDLKTTTEFLEVLTGALQGQETQEHIKEYRYVIYARKSTDDSEKQVRSLSDQVLECRDFAKTHGLKVVAEIQEAVSAKEPDTRPKFKEMIDDIRSGKYHGILAWHPDRLARNMKDAGEIIDLLDKRIIKDLKFVSFTFENKTSGKMLLGITFVLSKQYSDQLSDNVARGNERSIEEGKYINKAKHGYYKDPNQFLRPDGDNFLIIQNVFRLRLQGKTLDEIAEQVNHAGYQRWHKDKARTLYKMDKQKIQKILRDPTYTGVVVYGKRGGSIDLNKAYDFMPMLSVQDFMVINKLKKDSQFIKLARHFYKGDDVKADLLRGMVICAECTEIMCSGITAKKAKHGITHYFYYRCDTHECKKYGKSIRAKVILNWIETFLSEKPFSSKDVYNHYVKEMKVVSVERAQQNQNALLSFRSQMTGLEEKKQKIKDLMLEYHTDEKIKNVYMGDLLKLDADIEENQKNLDRVHSRITYLCRRGDLVRNNFLAVARKFSLP